MIPSGKQLEIFRLAGIPIRIDYSWFVIFLVYCWAISAVYLPSMAPELSRWLYWSLGVITTLLVFVSVLAHELAHAFFARRAGIIIRGITLYIFGGLAHLDREPDNAWDEFKIAAAGPAASFALAVLFFLIAELIFRGLHQLGLAKAMLHLGAVNLVVACFNLLPGFPMDGGRILRAIIWHRSKDYERATRSSLKSGATIAVSLICVGVITLFIQHDLLTGVWSIITGLLLVRLLHNIGPEILRAIKTQPKAKAAKAAAAASPINSNSKSATGTVAEVMNQAYTAVRPDMLVSELVKILPTNKRYNAFPVVQERRLHGILRLADLEGLPSTRHATTAVRELMQPVMAQHFIARDLSLEAATQQLSGNGSGQAAVLDSDGYVVGYLSLTDLQR